MPLTEQELRNRLSDELEAEGSLRSAQWRSAVECVPRHLFMPEFFRQVHTDSGVAWEPITEAAFSEDQRKELAYNNTTWVTQLDQSTVSSDVNGAIVSGDPTSSSTLPGLVVAMLEDLNVEDDDTVLEIGTGSGYSTALLCERVGSGNVVSIEADADVAAKAADIIHATGNFPVLVTGDGLAGFAPRSPYSKLIATCSVRSVPTAWINQTAPGGTILTTISGWQQGSAYARIARNDDNTAQGEFLADTYSFMLARPHQPPPVDVAGIAVLDGALTRRSSILAETMNSWEGRFIAQLANPDVQIVSRAIGEAPMTDYLLDGPSGSSASLVVGNAGEYLVRENGPVKLWERVEKSVDFWMQAGSPDLSQFRIEIAADSQRVYIDGHEALSWYLPAS